MWNHHQSHTLPAAGVTTGGNPHQSLPPIGTHTHNSAYQPQHPPPQARQRNHHQNGPPSSQPRYDAPPLVQYENNGSQLLENRVTNTERTTRQLLEDGLRLQRDLDGNVEYTERVWHGGKEATQALANHVRTITGLITQLMNQTERLEQRQSALMTRTEAASDLHTREIQKLATKLAGLEHTNNVVVEELRKRFLLYESRIQKVQTEQQGASDERRTLEREQTRAMEAISGEVRKLCGEHEQLKAHTGTIMHDARSLSQQIDGKTTVTIQTLEARIQASIAELNDQITSLRRHMDGNIDQAQSHLWNKTEGALALRTAKEDQIQNTLEMKIMHLERSLKDERDARAAFEAKLQTQFAERLEVALREAKHTSQGEHDYNKMTRQELAQGMQAATETIKAIQIDASVKRDELEQRFEQKIKRILNTIIT